MRIRWLPVAAFLALTVTLLAQQATRGQAGGKVTATVRYIDPKDYSEASLDFEVKKESPAGIEVLTGGGLKTISPDQIISVSYRGLPGVTLDQATKLSLEEDNDPAKAAGLYAAAATKATGAAKRFFEFRGAQAALKSTNSKKGADFEAEADATAKRLAEVVKNHSASWEVWPASRAAARLRMELGQHEEAAKLLSTLAAVPGLPPELKSSARIAEARTLLRAGKPKEAKAVLDLLTQDPSFPKAGALRQAHAILLAATAVPEPTTSDGKPVKPVAAIAKLEDAINAATDPEAKGIGFGVLGDVYAQHGFTRDAMWAYLWVDVVYPQNKDEQVIAIRRLANVFTAVGEAERAEQYRSKLASVR